MSIFSSLINLVKTWASKAINWLYNFIKKHWGKILGWWLKFKEFIQDLFDEEDDEEVVLLDPREEGGKEIVDAIRKMNPNVDPLDKFEDKYALGIKNGHIHQTHKRSAQAMQQDAFDNAAAQNNGVIRIGR